MKSGQEDYNHWIDIKDLTDTITFVPTKSNVNFDDKRIKACIIVKSQRVTCNV